MSAKPRDMYKSGLAAGKHLSPEADGPGRPSPHSPPCNLPLGMEIRLQKCSTLKAVPTQWFVHEKRFSPSKGSDCRPITVPQRRLCEPQKGHEMML